MDLHLELKKQKDRSPADSRTPVLHFMIMAGIVHNYLAGPGKLGKNGGVEPALVNGEHWNAVYFW